LVGGRGNQRIAIEETRSSEAVTTLTPNPGSGNQFKMLGAVRHGIVNQAPIEGRQLALVSTSERKQVRVSQSSGRQHTGGVDVFSIQHAHVVRPESVPRVGWSLYDEW